MSLIQNFGVSMNPSSFLRSDLLLTVEACRVTTCRIIPTSTEVALNLSRRTRELYISHWERSQTPKWNTALPP